MAVIMMPATDYENTMARCVCSVCGGKLHPPFLTLNAGVNLPTDLAICKGCCRQVKEGLIADIIHLAAIAELQEFIGWPSNETFYRIKADYPNITKHAEVEGHPTKEQIIAILKRE